MLILIIMSLTNIRFKLFYIYFVFKERIKNNEVFVCLSTYCHLFDTLRNRVL